MVHASKEQQRRDRVREYDSALGASRVPLSVMVHFVRAREARSSGVALEEAFGSTAVDGVEERLPAAVWVALRRADLDAALQTLVRGSRRQFLIAEHEELDAGYRLMTVAERRGLPDMELLVDQIAAFLQIPPDVVAMIATWDPDDPKTVGEVNALLDQRFGPPPAGDAAAKPAAPSALSMSSTEFVALLQLTPQQQSVLATLVRQSDITVSSG
jgi:hypothetical protein